MEERSGESPRCRIAGEVDSFRVANDRETKRPSQGLSTQITIAPTNRRQPCTHLGYALRWARIECSGKQNLQAPEAARRRPSGPKNHPRQKTLGMASSRRNPPTTRTVWGLLIQRSVWSGRQMWQDAEIKRNTAILSANTDRAPMIRMLLNKSLTGVRSLPARRIFLLLLGRVRE